MASNSNSYSPSVSDWKLSQVFGQPSSSDDLPYYDVITSIEFDRTGDNLAIGDRGGRVVIFERTATNDDLVEFSSQNGSDNIDLASISPPKFRYKTEFQSHEPEFDYLKSLEIDEKINKVRWCISPNGSLLLLSANDRTIKLWKVKENKVKKVKQKGLHPVVSLENSVLAEKSHGNGHHQPSLGNGHGTEWTEKVNDGGSSSPTGNPKKVEDAASARCRKVYAHAHDFNINSLSNNSDGETFLSADDFMINLWNLETSNQCFNIIDRKPPNMEDLTEVITSAEFHPFHCNLLAYSSTRGFIRIVDMRQSAICDHNAKILKDGRSSGPRSFFTEIIGSISSLKFTPDGKHILARDYMNMKLWDVRMETSPVAVYKVHEHLRPKLSDLYNNDAIFDKFGCCSSGDGLHFATGSYSNRLRVFSHANGEDGVTIEASINSNRKSHSQPTRTRRSSLSNLTRGFYRQATGQEIFNSASSGAEIFCDFNSKLLQLAWHPKNDLIGCAAGGSLFMYCSEKCIN